MEIYDVFKKTHKIKGIKLPGYESLQINKDYNDVVYFVRKFHENNFDFATMKVALDNKKIVFTAGSSIKILDAFMLNYLKTRENNHEEVFKNIGIEEKNKVLFSEIIPRNIYKLDIVKRYINNDFKVLYVRDSGAISKTKRYTIDVVLYKEDTVGDDTTYIVFNCLQFIPKSNEIGFHELVTGDLQIPTFLLK